MMLEDSISSAKLHKLFMSLDPYKYTATEIERRRRLPPIFPNVLTERKRQRAKTSLLKFFQALCEVLEIGIVEKDGKIDFAWVGNPRQRGPKRVIVESIRESNLKIFKKSCKIASSNPNKHIQSMHLTYVRLAIKIMAELEFTDVNTDELKLKRGRKKAIKAKSTGSASSRIRMPSTASKVLPLPRIVEEYAATIVGKSTTKTNEVSRLRVAIKALREYLNVEQLDLEKESLALEILRSGESFSLDDLRQTATYYMLMRPSLVYFKLFRYANARLSCRRDLDAYRLFDRWINNNFERDKNAVSLPTYTRGSMRCLIYPVLKSYFSNTASTLSKVKRLQSLNELVANLHTPSLKVDPIHESYVWEETLNQKKALEFSEEDKATFTWRLCFNYLAVLEAMDNMPDEYIPEVRRVLEYARTR